MGRNKTRTIEQRKKDKREAERRRRARIKDNPVKYALHLEKEKERRKRRKEEKKNKVISDLTPREQRIKRKEWREYACKRRAMKRSNELFIERLREDSPPSESSISSRPPSRANVEEINMSSPSSSVSSIISRQKEVGLKIARKNRTAKDLLIKQQRTTIENFKKKFIL